MDLANAPQKAQIMRRKLRIFFPDQVHKVLDEIDRFGGDFFVLPKIDSFFSVLFVFVHFFIHINQEFDGFGRLNALVFVFIDKFVVRVVFYGVRQLEEQFLAACADNNGAIDGFGEVFELDLEKRNQFEGIFAIFLVLLHDSYD